MISTGIYEPEARRAAGLCRCHLLAAWCMHAAPRVDEHDVTRKQSACELI